MRIIKLSPGNSQHFKDKKSVISFFTKELSSRTEKGKFRIPKGVLDEKKFKVGEKLLFSYNKEILFASVSKSEKLQNNDEYKKELPFYFLVDTDNLHQVSELTLDDLEQKIRKIFPGKNIVKSEGWPIIDENSKTNKLWKEILSSNIKDVSVNQEERAYRAWNILYETAKKKTTITYGELAQKLGVHHRTCRFFLEHIQNHCLKNKMNPLTILVVNQHGAPGEGFIAWDIDDAVSGMKAVYDNLNSFKVNPFSHAHDGHDIESLSKLRFNGDLDDKYIYSLIKGRGSGQVFFKSLMRKIYKNKCAFCGLDIVETLQASHILDWSKCKGAQKISPNNGLLLCANHHLLFDKGILSIDENYEIVLGPKGKDYSKKEYIKDVLEKKIKLPDLKEHYPSKDLIKKNNDV